VGMEFFGFAVTFLAAVLTVLAWRNGRDMRRLVEAIREDGRRRHEEAVALINGHRLIYEKCAQGRRTKAEMKAGVIRFRLRRNSAMAR